MMNKKTVASSAKKVTFTKKKAMAAVKAAKEAYAKKPIGQSAAWKKGGREWLRVLGHFGTSTARASKK